MKKLLFLLLFIISFGYANAVTVYILPTGSNSAAGTISAPWRTLAFAGANTSFGDIIHVLPGTYNESAACNLAVGVSIEGEGVTSYIISTYTGGAAINMVSNTDGVNGNQHISNIRLSGSNLTGRKGIYVLARSNVKIYNCTIQDFLQDGIIIKGTDNGGQPSVYATGNEIYNCIITNNSDRNTGQGNIVATGYRGLLIHDNVITQMSRPLGNNGNTYSATTEGFCEGLKFYNNKSYRNPNEGNEWSFHLELWSMQGGVEIYNNEFWDGDQMIDFGGADVTKGTYPYAAWIHDNLFRHTNPVNASSPFNFQDIAINLEGDCSDIIIEDNHFKYCPYGVQTVGGHSNVGHNRITIQNNLFEDGGFVTNEWCFDIALFGEPGKSVNNVTIYNNTFVTTKSQSALFIYTNPTSTISNISFINNIVQGTRTGYISFYSNDGTKTGYSVRNNLLYQNANGNAIDLQAGAVLPSGTYTGNFVGNPLFDATYHLTASSPAINAGIDVGLPFTPPAPDCGCFEYPGSTVPVANAGSDVTITLPINTVTLTGSATTTITTWTWTKLPISPVAGTVSNLNTQTSSAINLVQGVYQFELLVVNSAGLTDRDTMQVTVNTVVPVNPSCGVGTTPVTVTPPVATASLLGTATTSPVSNGATYLWEKTLGTGGTIASPTSLVTSISGLLPSTTYNLRLTVTDAVNGLTCQATKVIIVNATPIVPTANAGSDQTIQLPTSQVTLSGSGSGGTITSYLWTLLQGVCTGCNFTNNTAASTAFTGLTQGTYLVELRVGNSVGNFGRDTVLITVNAANVAPSCSAGSTPITIQLPTNSIALNGTGSSTPVSNGVSYLWTQTAGAAMTITNPTSALAFVNNMTAGTFTFRLRVTDNVSGLTCFSNKDVTVLSALVTPTANAGTNQTITLPTNSVSLTGSGSGGTINSYQWTKISGIGGTFSAATSANTNFSGLVQGVYQVELRVGNTDGLFGRDTVQITVLPAIVLPTATCAPNITITLPVNFCTLVGTGTGTQTPLVYQWTKLTGTGGALSTATATQTQFTGLSAGTYTVEYKVTDNNSNVARDTMSVTVVTSLSAPIVSAGADQVLVLPTTTTTLTGSYILGSGTVTSILWQQISGSSSTITTPTTLSTGITGLAVGDYYYSLRITTSDGYAVADTVKVSVIAVPVLPGFEWFNASLINNKAQLKWRYNGVVKGVNFNVQRQVLFFFWSNIGTVTADTERKEYSFVDNNTKRGNNVYRVEYSNKKTNSITVNKR